MPTIPAKVKEALGQVLGEELKPPPEIEARIKRGTEAMAEGAPRRNECLRFSRGRQYSWVDSQNVLREQDTTSRYKGRGGKARHRVRSVRNYIFNLVEYEVAGATQKIPGYEVAPTSNDPKRISAARLARKVAYYEYEQANVRKASERAIRYAIVADEGFAWPYFDNTVGPYMPIEVSDAEGKPTGEVKQIGQGEIKVRVYGPNEVFWEPGLNFDESPWLGIKQARDLDKVMESDGYVGGELRPDAQQAETSTARRGAAQTRLVLVTEYLERPSPRRPDGRWLTIANGRVIIPERPYPCRNGEGKVLDEPVLHKITYAEDPDADRDMGLVRHLLDPQRALNHAVSKIGEWINLALVPQLLVVNGKVLSGKQNDVPGAITRIAGTGEVKWKPVPPIPPELFTQKQEAMDDMSGISAQSEIHSGLSARALQYLLEHNASRRANFYANLADYHARLMRHILYLVQAHYTEPRLLKIRGEQGIEPIKDFLGSELLNEVDVRVTTDSIEPLTREAIEAKIMGFAERGWISPHEAMAAINNGTSEGLIQSYERDVARANLLIQKCKEGPEVLFATPPRRPFFGEDPGIDGETGLPREYVPGWMPRPFDNIPVQKDQIADWMKSVEYDELPPPAQEAINAVFDGMLQLEAKKQAQEAAAQTETAQALGTANAARPGSPAPLPSQAPLGGQSEKE